MNEKNKEESLLKILLEGKYHVRAKIERKILIEKECETYWENFLKERERRIKEALK